tara:strand:+ start:905 stop:1765 length:861 start_codon:yes stop_codon:yes gene_type:complete
MKRSFIIGEEQVKMLVNEIGEVLRGTDIRGYSFDWDDNILYMPTKIKMERSDGGDWVPVDVSTTEFAELRNDPKYRLGKNSFINFREPESFIRDTKKAIDEKMFGPSFEKFKESLIYANPFSIITARGTSPNAIKEGVRILISMTFSPEEIGQMVENITESYPSARGLGLEETIDFYLGENDYSPVSSLEFRSKFGIESDADNPEEGKKIALKDYVTRVVMGAKNIANGEHTNLSIGFSDDDKKNVEAVISYIEDELSSNYPEIKFLVYDTSKGDKNKIIVSKVGD